MVTYLFGHCVNIRIGTIVHHCIGKHQENVPLKLKGCCDNTILDPRLNSLEIHRSLNNFAVIRCFRVFNWVVEYVAIPVLGYLRVKHSNDILEAFDSNLLFSGCMTFAASAGWPRVRPCINSNMNIVDDWLD